MVKGNVIASLLIEPEPFFTDGSTIHGVLTLDIRKQDTVIGPLVARLTCEQTVPSHKDSSVVASVVLSNVPPEISRGPHSFDFDLAIPSENVEPLPPSVYVNSRSAGVYWVVEVCEGSPAARIASHIVPVYPARKLDLGNSELEPMSYRKETRRIPMLTSFEEGGAHKQRPKLFVMLFGPSYRLPKKGEICEVFVRIDLKIPESGVMQTPSKAQFPLTLSAAVENSVVLTMCSAKLISAVSIKDTGKVYKSTVNVWSSDLDISLPRGPLDISDVISDVELPLCPGTMENSYMKVQYEISFTFVLRAAHFENITRWVNLTAPITVHPASLRLADAPPPYVG